MPRLRKVIEGEQGGISEAVGWKGGGGFSFYRLGETIFNLYGAINPKIKFPALAQYIWFMETGFNAVNRYPQRHRILPIIQRNLG